MPLPLFLLGGLAAAVGIGGHIDAKETNEKAQKVSNDAQTLYNNAKYSLQSANRTEIKLFKTIKSILCISLCVESAFILKTIASNTAGSIGTVILSAILGIIFLFVFGVVSDSTERLPSLSSIRIFAIRISALLVIFFAAEIIIGLLGYISVTMAIIITLILFAPISLIAVFAYEIVVSNENQ